MSIDLSAAKTQRSAYDFTMRSIDGKEIPLSAYKGKVLLIVNTASECGYTKQYESLEKLYDQLKSKGFEVLGFPSNDFGGQEPGSEAEIKKFCQTRFNVEFPLFAKVTVKGSSKVELYKWLTESSSPQGEVKWNFEKFLVDRSGKIVARFSSGTEPLSKELTSAIDKVL